MIRYRSTQAWRDQVRSDHATLRESLAWIRTELERLGAEAGPSHAAGGLLTALRGLRDSLARHFAHEESAELDPAPQGRDATLARLHQELLAQHATLLAELDQLRDAAARADGADFALSDRFVVGLRRFLDDLGRHEREENALFLEGVDRDVGGEG